MQTNKKESRCIKYGQMKKLRACGQETMLNDHNKEGHKSLLGIN
jgi:hypothetical protein